MPAEPAHPAITPSWSPPRRRRCSPWVPRDDSTGKCANCGCLANNVDLFHEILVSETRLVRRRPVGAAEIERKSKLHVHFGTGRKFGIERGRDRYPSHQPRIIGVSQVRAPLFSMPNLPCADWSANCRSRAKYRGPTALRCIGFLPACAPSMPPNSFSSPYTSY